MRVMNSSVVTGFGQGLLLDGKLAWNCGQSGSFMRQDFISNFNPSVDMGTFYGIGWTLTGNWQLYLRGNCTWKCKPCACGGCECYTRCRLRVDISKVYTFIFVGGNPWNIGTSIVALDPFQTTYIMHNQVVVPYLEVGTKKCK